MKIIPSPADLRLAQSAANQATLERQIERIVAAMESDSTSCSVVSGGWKVKDAVIAAMCKRGWRCTFYSDQRDGDWVTWTAL